MIKRTRDAWKIINNTRVSTKYAFKMWSVIWWDNWNITEEDAALCTSHIEISWNRILKKIMLIWKIIEVLIYMYLFFPDVHCIVSALIILKCSDNHLGFYVVTQQLDIAWWNCANQVRMILLMHFRWYIVLAQTIFVGRDKKIKRETPKTWFIQIYSIFH